MNLFQRGDFRLASGQRTGWKIECDALTEEDWRTLAHLAVAAFGWPGEVQGVPRGGLRFAEALREVMQFSSFRNGPLWIVDDVLTTGGSMDRYLISIGNPLPVRGVVVFARGACPDWVDAIFKMG